MAIGATRWRLIRNLLVDHVVVALFAVVAGLLLAEALTKFLSMRITGIPVEWHALPWRVAGVITVVAVGLVSVASICTGYVVVLRTSFTSLSANGAVGVRHHETRHFYRRLLVVEVSISYAIVLCSMGLLVASIRRRAGWQRFRPNQLMVATLVPTGSRRAENKRQLLNAIRQLGFVVAAAEGTLPTNFPVRPRSVWTDSAVVHLLPPTALAEVDPGYFAAMGIHFLYGGPGAYPKAGEGQGGGVILSGSVYERLFGHDRSLGHRMRLESEGPWLRVLGVVEDLPIRAPSGKGPLPVIYADAHDLATTGLRLLVRVPHDVPSFIPEVRRLLETDAPYYHVAELESAQSRLVRERSVINAIAIVIAIFALTTIADVMIGIVSLTSDHVLRRRREIGVRMALGAPPRVVIAQMLGETAAVWAWGVLGGAILAQVWNRVDQAVGLLPPPTLGMATGLAAIFAVVLGALSFAIVAGTARSTPSALLLTDP
jgi:predicted lysophospholipase L1 biosynthesis ABC-type transport system permease subunit